MEAIILSYPVAFDRADARVTLADITKTIEDFTGETGRLPAALYLNPERINKLAGQLPEIPIIEHAGICSWELWLSIEMSAGPVNPHSIVTGAHEEAQDIKEATFNTEMTQSPIPLPVTEFQPQIFHPTIEELIKETVANAKTSRERSSRTIARLLNARGFRISHMTVHRRMKSFIR